MTPRRGRRADPGATGRLGGGYRDPRAVAGERLRDAALLALRCALWGLLLAVVAFWVLMVALAFWVCGAML